MKKGKHSEEPIKSSRDLSPREKECIYKAQTRNVNFSSLPPLFKAKDKAGTSSLSYELKLDPSLPKQEGNQLIRSRLMNATGSNDPEVALERLHKTAAALCSREVSAEAFAGKMDRLLRVMEGLQPQDDIEAQLIAQLNVLHEQSMHWLSMAMQYSKPELVNLLVNAASKQLCRYQETLDSLLKYRRRGEQRVHVEHVHVHQGAQAIVGIVSRGSE